MSNQPWTNFDARNRLWLVKRDDDAKQACGVCGGTGWAPVERDGVRVGVDRCECWKAERPTVAEGIPLEFERATFETYREQEGNKAALRAAKAFAVDSRDLYLAGGVGSGKTRLACTVLNAWFSEMRAGLFVRVPMMLLQLQPGRDEDDRLFNRLRREPLLVLDDVGSERDSSTDFTRRTLLTIYEDRCDQGLRTIWTSNLRLSPDPAFAIEDRHRPPTLGEFMGDDRLASRIAGRAVVALLTTSDQRLKHRTRRGE